MDERPYLEVRLTLLGTDDGGRKGPIRADTPYRPQLWIGQRLAADPDADGAPVAEPGPMMQWDCQLLLQGRSTLEPGETGGCRMMLGNLPPSVLHERELLEFYEGPRRVGTGVVTRSVVPDPTAEEGR